MAAPVRAPSGRAPRTLACLTVSVLVLLGLTGVALACVAPAEPTTLTTSLSGESKSGAEITVLEGTKVKDQATLEGKNAGKATGKISYAVYKDSSCKELVTKAGESEFKEGKVPASEEKTLEAGKTYYWQAHYGGDSLDAESTSTCGSEVLKVKAATSVSTSLSGEAKSGESITVLEGSGVKDKATLSGTNSWSATGTVKYKVYKDSECKELATSAGEVTVSGGSVPESESKTLEGGRVYYWQASYEGDSLHQASTGSCGKEVLTVKAATALSTSLSGEEKSGETITVLEGTKVKDKATLTGTNVATATGKVAYAVYKDSECKELATEAGEVTVAAGSVPSSEEKTLEAGRTYYWKTSYSGDSLHAASVGTCGSEVENVKAATTLSTSLSGEEKSGETITVLEGSKVKDKATLAGTNAATAGGTVGYSVYADSECKELVTTAGEVTVTAGSVPASSEETMTAGARYYWRASYAGDARHSASVSPCSEIETVKAATSISTLLLGGGEEATEITVGGGSPVIDTAELGGTASSTATGTITFRVYADNECKELVAEAGEVEIEEGILLGSQEQELGEGVYYWRAAYGGDALHQAATSSCGDEIQTVIGATSLTTELSGEGESGAELEVVEGTAVSDAATLAGKNAATATGMVKYAVYADAECTDLVTEAGEVSVEGEAVPPSEPETLEAGLYFWQAEYSGDGSNHAAVSECGTEVEAVTTPLTTTLSSGEASGTDLKVLAGEAVTDSATLWGPHAAEATGTVAYKVYEDEECTELATTAGEVEVEGETAPPSEPETLEPGMYYWQAEYSGDLENPPATSVCGSETMRVVSPTTLAGVLSGGEEEGAEIVVEEGTTVTDVGTVSGTNAGTAVGSVEYAVYADEGCTELEALGGDGAVTEGTALASVEEELPAGTYYWQATYSGDGVNQEAISPCGGTKLTVTAPVTAELSDEEASGTLIEVSEETPVTDRATLHGEHASEANGKLRYKIYSDEECEVLATSAGEVTLESKALAPPSSEVELEEGNYYPVAEYLGDAKNPPAKSRCGSEELIVRKPEVTKYAALGDSFSSGLGIANTYYPPTIPGPGNPPNPNMCFRSQEAWPVLVAGRLFGAPAIGENEVFKQSPPQFIFRACQGAITDNLWSGGAKPEGQYHEAMKAGGAWTWSIDKPAQNLWLSLPGGVKQIPIVPDNKLKLVTVTIGGNDVNFANVATACTKGRPAIGKDPGYSLLDCFEKILENEALLAPLVKPHLATVVTNIHAAAPKARIRLLLYPRIIDPDRIRQWARRLARSPPGMSLGGTEHRQQHRTDPAAAGAEIRRHAGADAGNRPQPVRGKAEPDDRRRGEDAAEGSTEAPGRSHQRTLPMRSTPPTGRWRTLGHQFAFIETYTRITAAISPSQGLCYRR